MSQISVSEEVLVQVKRFILATLETANEMPEEALQKLVSEEFQDIDAVSAVYHALNALYKSRELVRRNVPFACLSC
jgi:hypothetical protein